jgi:hypothetical protein
LGRRFPLVGFQQLHPKKFAALRAFFCWGATTPALTRWTHQETQQNRPTFLRLKTDRPRRRMAGPPWTSVSPPSGPTMRSTATSPSRRSMTQKLGRFYSRRISDEIIASINAVEPTTVQFLADTIPAIGLICRVRATIFRPLLRFAASSLAGSGSANSLNRLRCCGSIS